MKGLNYLYFLFFILAFAESGFSQVNGGSTRKSEYSEQDIYNLHPDLKIISDSSVFIVRTIKDSLSDLSGHWKIISYTKSDSSECKLSEPSFCNLIIGKINANSYGEKTGHIHLESKFTRPAVYGIIEKGKIKISVIEILKTDQCCLSVNEKNLIRLIPGMNAYFLKKDTLIFKGEGQITLKREQEQQNNSSNYNEILQDLSPYNTITNPKAETRFSKQVTKKQLQGGWLCVGGRDEIANHDEMWSAYSGSSHLLFKDDTLWRFEYPCLLLELKKYKINADNFEEIDLKPGKKTENFEFSTINMVNDTLKIFKNSPGFHSEGYYLPYKFDAKIIAKLKRDKSNSDCLESGWELLRYENYYGDEHSYTYPFTLKDTIIFSRNDLKQALHKRSTVLIPINGKMKPCYWEFSGSGYTLSLKPAGWWKERNVEIIYR
ncbi:MAG: hypothetical protein IAF38_21480, partial [Bacteroidia bacterium]|nr:hypothetical protein [Bacteroidia bacterium]